MKATVEKTRPAQAVANVDLSGSLMQVSAASWARTTFDTSANRQLFSVLAEWWHEATDAIASPTEKIQHSAYRKIVDGGMEMVPYILQDLMTRGGDWYAALRAITNADPDPVSAKHYGRPRDMTKDWVAWAKEHGYLV